ncbi:alpha/beta fold hydrolase [Streptomyces sp. SCUT-3]|uniref:esterase/lipase family protein n=1 Tax=Streptomyces sp. SCUT-3 TaxID=2684469 RepID=UPI000CA7A87F|nr:alpha/beta fold hydrolase [Streptomyces sp. SCUT-3]PLW67211.1 lipase [Streptomyces sp. DJ]QMV22100.1 alpha/beta fold hydrolase [Streptomyces sp. SCUT-3]
MAILSFSSFSLPLCAPTGLGEGCRRTAALARAVGVDVAVLTAHMLLYPTGMAQERLLRIPDGDGGAPRTPSPDRARPPVLLMHGFVDNRSVFALLRRSLHRNGWTHVQALNYSPLTCDVRVAAALLARHVEEVCRSTGHRRLDIVGHSLGGLIARYYVQRLGGDARVRTLVTLGTPHSGTRAALLLAPHPIVRQMRPGSGLIGELAMPAPECRTRFVAFWSDMDQVMSPIEAARVEHPDLTAHNVLVSGVGHLTLPVHGEVAAGTRRALAGPGGPAEDDRAA